MYKALDAEKIIETIDRLRRRISERFPSSGLLRVCAELQETAVHCRERAQKIDASHVPLRVGVGVVILAIVAFLAAALASLKVGFGTLSLAEFVQFFEPALNSMVLIGAAIFFLITIETRIKRSRALNAITELRALAHVIDMHQLTKDPERTLSRGSSTASSPIRTMSAFELTRYLDYSSEMLSIIGKLAALYVQHFGDPVVVTAVNELENLTSGLSRKMWQKIMILHQFEGREAASEPPPGPPPS